MNEAEFVDRLWAAGWSYNLSDVLAEIVDAYGIGVGQVTPEIMRLVLGQAAKNRRKKIGRKHAARMVIRRRREYNHDLAIRERHIRETIWARDGMRCFGCRDVPPQPGEIMDQECLEVLK